MKIKSILGTIGCAVPIILFSIYYLYCYYMGFVIQRPSLVVSFAYYSLFFGLMCFNFYAGIDSENKKRHLVYYTGGTYWSIVLLIYISKQIGFIESKNIGIIALSFSSVSLIVLYLADRYKYLFVRPYKLIKRYIYVIMYVFLLLYILISELWKNSLLIKH